MIVSLLSALAVTFASDEPCPPISFSELQPPVGEEFLYSFWRDRAIQPGSFRVEVTRSGEGEVQVDTSFFMAREWTPRTPQRVIAGVVLFNQNEFNGTSPRQVHFRPLSPPLSERSLSHGDEMRLSATETAEVTSGETQYHEGHYLISHAGCGELIHEGETIRTRKLRVEFSRFLGQPEAGWTLTDMVQIYHIPLGANWFYAQHRENNHPMQQGTVMQGYTVP